MGVFDFSDVNGFELLPVISLAKSVAKWKILLWSLVVRRATRIASPRIRQFRFDKQIGLTIPPNVRSGMNAQE